MCLCCNCDNTVEIESDSDDECDEIDAHSDSDAYYEE